MTKRIIPIFILLCLLGSCAPAPAAPTSTPTTTVPPTRTPRPTQTSVPTATPYPPLQTDGPYLLFTNDNKNFTIMDADGSGRKQFQLPNDGYIWNLENAVSPDGTWLAFYTGSTKEPYDLALNLLNISEGYSQLIADLVAPNFPNNLEPVTETVEVSEYDTDCFNNLLCKLGLVELTFNSTIRSFAWSPDSQELAFAAQIDGPSSDIYIYQIESGIIRRLINDLEIVDTIEWSPNGEKILYTNSIPGRIYNGKTLQIADPESKLIQDPKSIYGGSFWSNHGWLSNNQYLISSSGDGAPLGNLKILNIENQQFTEIWPHHFEFFAIDKSTQTIIISTIPFSNESTEPEIGVYLLSKSGKYTQISQDFFALYSGLPDLLFFGITDDQAYSLSLDGNKTLIGKSLWNHPPSVSPDKQWIVLHENEKRITLYSIQYEKRGSWGFDGHIYRVFWHPSSIGIFFTSLSYVYYLPVPNGEPHIVYDCSPTEFCGGISFIWLP